MQKPQITYYFVLQTTYELIEIGLFADNKNIGFVLDDKLKANATLVNHLQKLLDKNSISRSQLSFIAVNQGPAPFTSLRIILATANGISFGSGIPLIGIDGLRAFMIQYSDPEWPMSVGLFNAYHGDCYYALQQPKSPIKTGSIAVHKLDQILPKNQQIRFIGQGVPVFSDYLKTVANAVIQDPLPCSVSIEYIASQALQKWRENEPSSTQLLPLYLKETTYQPSLQNH